MIGPNLSDWALKHRSFIIFTMIAIVIAGLTSYFRLGRNEDPAFTFRTMIVQAAWPGATLDDTLTQLTERLERKLQETRACRSPALYTSPGLTTIFVNLKGATSSREVPDIWYQVRKNIGDIRRTLPQGVVGPGFNNEISVTHTALSMHRPLTVLAIVSCAIMSKKCARSCCRFRTSPRSRSSARRTSRFLSNSRQADLQALGSTAPRW